MFPPREAPASAAPPPDALGQYNPAAQAPVTGGLSGSTPDLRESLNPLKLPLEEIEEWWKRIERAKDRRKQCEETWDVLLKEYLPIVKGSGVSEAVKINAHFRNVHTKIGQLFVRSPEVQLAPKGPALDQVMIPDPITGLPRAATPEEVIPIKQAVINSFMGRDHINGTRLMDECLFDILAWAGLCCLKVGYRRTTKMIQQPVMQPDPTFVPPPPTGGLQDLAPSPQPPQVPVMNPLTGQPQTRAVPVPIHEEWYASRFSPKKLLLDPDLHSTRYDDYASWIGQEFFLPKRQALREFGLTEDDLQATDADDRVFKHEHDTRSQGMSREFVHGYEIWYKAALYTDEIHPLAMNQLVLFEGMHDRTAVSRPSADQSFDEFGKLTDDSLIGFPIKIGVLRDLADSPFPLADSAFTNSQVKELNTHRRQSVQLRDVAIGKYLYDQGAFEESEVDLLKNGQVGEWIGVKEGLLSQGADKLLYTTPQVKSTPDDFRTSQILKQDMDETLGISAAQAGTPLETVRSATEIAEFSSSAAGRQEKEQNRAIEFYLSIVRAIDTLIVRYAQGDDYVSVVGEDGTRKLVQWNRKIIAGKYSYDIAPDSQLQIDAARARQQELAFYNMVAKDRLVNRVPVLRRLAMRFSHDPFKIVADPATQMTQLGYGGPASKHGAEQSGQMPNAPGSQGDNRQERNPREGGRP